MSNDKKGAKETVYSIWGWLAVILIAVAPVVATYRPAIADFMTQLRTATPIVSNYTAKKEIQESAGKFIEAFFMNDFETAKAYILIEDEAEEEFFKGLFDSLASIRSITFGLEERFSGIRPKITYEIVSIRLINEETARITYILRTNTRDEISEIDTTLLKNHGKWKVHFMSFLTGWDEGV